MKSDVDVAEKHDLALAKLSILNIEKYWQKLVNTDNKRSILFPGSYIEKRFGNKEIPFHILKSKYLYDYDVAFKHLNEEYGLSKNDYKLYNVNLLRNDEYIKDHQNNHRYFDSRKPKLALKNKTIKKS